MTTKKRIITIFSFIIFCGFSLIGSATSFQQTAGELYEKALYYEEAQGDIQKAIDLYKKVLEQFSENREIAAKAQLHIGFCYEKLGHNEAVKAYELVVQNFADQKEPVSTARARLAELIAKKAEKPVLEKLWSMQDDKVLLEAQSLSPDGTKLLGINVARDKGQNVAYKDLNSKKFIYITNFLWLDKEHGWTYSPVWSPDSKHVAFNFGGNKDGIKEIRIADLNGESQTIFRCETAYEDIYPCGWFPDGRSLLAIHLTKEKAIRLGIVPTEGGDFELIYETKAPSDANFRPDAGKYFQSNLSQDGRLVVFGKADGEIMNLYVIDIATKALHVLTDSPANDEEPKWSPDGKFIAFMSNRMGNKALWAVPIEKDGSLGGQPFLLRDSMEHANLLNWTAHGLPYENWVSSQDIFVLPVDPQTGAPTGKPRQLEYRPTGDNNHPVFSPDGKFLAFASNVEDRGQGRHVVVYPLSGGKPKSFRIPSSNFRASLFDLRWLSDGSGIGFSGNATHETPGWHEGMNPFMVFQLKLDTGEWRTWELDLPWSRTEWHKDGNAFFYGVNGGESNSHKAGIIEKDLASDSERYIYQLEGSAAGVFRALRCSRDYTKLAFYQEVGKHIAVIDIKSGKTLRKFLGYLNPAWSPDGRFIMAQRGIAGLHVLSLADGSKREYDLSETLPLGQGGIIFFDWSPDGSQVAFSFMFARYTTHLIQDVIPTEK